MLVDSKYEKYAQLCPRQYDFVTSCTFGQAKEALNDPYCPAWAKDMLKQRFSVEFTIQRKDDEKKKAAKLKALHEHPNADACIVNIALTLYNENSKMAICDKLPLEKCFDVAFEIYNRNFVL